MSRKGLFPLILLALAVFCFPGHSFAQNGADQAAVPAKEEKKINITELVFGHVGDSHEWHFFEWNGSPVALPLPVIAYQPGKGLQVFSSAHFEEWTRAGEDKRISNSYNGFHLERAMKEKLIADDGSAVYDLSITKNVLSMLI